MAETTLRETISGLADRVEAGEDITTPEAPVVEQPAETVESKPGRTAGRERDEQGRLLPGKSNSAARVPPPDSSLPATVLPVAAEPEKQRPPRPSSWKKEYWDDWEKIDPKVAEYLHQRESEFAKGVSTYKNEWEQAKPLLDAVAPYQQELKQYGIDPAQQIDKYMQIHRALALGTPEQKLGIFLQIANDYQVPVQNLFTRGQDGQIYYQQNLPTPQIQQRQPDMNQQVAQVVDARLADMMAQQETQRFTSEKDVQGNPAYPHFEQVREQMARLLESGFADDLKGAYQKAVRMNDDLFQQDLQSKQQTQEQDRQKKLAEEAQRARRQAVSPKSATPASAASDGKKGLRATIADAVEQHLGGARV